MANENIESTHYRAEVELSNFQGTYALYFHKNDPKTEDNLRRLQNFVGCEIVKVTVKDPQDPLIVQWRNNVQGGNTILGFEAWKEQHHG